MKLIISNLIILGIFLTGCVKKETCVPVVTIKEIKVPVYPDIPDIDCEFNGDGLEPVDKLIDCISYQKHILDLLKDKRQEQIK